MKSLHGIYSTPGYILLRPGSCTEAKFKNIIIITSRLLMADAPPVYNENLRRYTRKYNKNNRTRFFYNNYTCLCLCMAKGCTYNK